MLHLLVAVLLAQSPAPQLPPPRKTHDVRPVYPREAMGSGAQGLVLIEITIDERGKVSKAVVKRSIPQLDAAALAAVKQWEYEATIVDGKAVSRVATVSVNFAVQNARPASTAPLVPSSTPGARQLFDEARGAIARVAPGPDPPGIDTRPLTQPMLLVQLAKAEAGAFPDQAADDAERAFALAQSIEGREPDPSALASSGSARTEATRLALGWIAKGTIEPDVIRVLLAAKRNARARELARTADTAHAPLYDAIVRAAPAADLLTLANECRSTDGSYPYAAIADRARTMTDERARQTLLLAAYRTAVSETTYSGRGSAQTLLQRTWDLLPADVVSRALVDMLNGMISQPANVPLRNVPDSEMFAPMLLELLAQVDPPRASQVAVDHPDWETARNTPGRTPGNPLNGPRGLGRPVAQPPQPPLILKDNHPRLPQVEFERQLASARAQPVTEERITTLIGLGISLLP